MGWGGEGLIKRINLVTKKNQAKNFKKGALRPIFTRLVISRHRHPEPVRKTRRFEFHELRVPGRIEASFVPQVSKLNGKFRKGIGICVKKIIGFYR